MDYKKPVKKKFGQHFLSDEVILDEIYSIVSPQKEDIFIEIGPGSGVLTGLLLENASQVVAVEIDKDCVEYLEKKYSNSNLKVINKDVLNFDLRCIKERGPFRWIGNLPYNISTPFLLSLSLNIDLFKDGYFMVQQEVADRCSALPGSKKYGRLSVMLGYYFDISQVLYVPPESFSPAPKVCSQIIHMKVHNKKYVVKDKNIFSEVVAIAFQQRRKMLRKIFSELLDEKDWNNLVIDSKLRPEFLTISNFIEIANYVSSLKSN